MSGARDAGGAVTEAMVEAGARALLIARGAGPLATDAEWPSTLDRHRRLSDDLGAFHGESRSLLADAFRDARVAITAALALRPAQPEADALREEVGRLRAALTTAEEAIASACRQRDASDRALAEARGVLRQVEWVTIPTGPTPAFCPTCWRYRRVGHAPGCALAAQFAADPGPGTAGASTGGEA